LAKSDTEYYQIALNFNHK